MGVGQSNQPFSAPRPRSLPTFGSNQDPNQVLAQWQANIQANIRTAAPQAQPANFTITNAQGGLQLNWGQVPTANGADGYELLKSVSGSFKSDLQIIPIPHPNTTSYFDSIGPNSTKCSYKLRTTSGTPERPQSARGPETGTVSHFSIAAGDTKTSPTSVRDLATTDKSRAMARLGNYGNIAAPLGATQATSGGGGGTGSGSSGGSGSGGSGSGGSGSGGSGGGGSATPPAWNALTGSLAALQTIPFINP